MIKVRIFNNNEALYITDTVKEYNQLLTEGRSVVPEYTYSDSNPSTLNDKDTEGIPWPHSEYVVTDSDDMDDKELYRIYQRQNNLPWYILATEHFLIRETTVADVDYFYEIYSEPGITDYIEPLFDDPQDEKLYTRNYIKDIYGFYGFGMWTVVNLVTGVIVGRAGISMIDGYEYPELGFVTSLKYQHQGYTYEILKAIMDYSKNELGFTTIQARVKPENIRSINLLERLGFSIPHIPQRGYLTALHTFS